LDFEYPAYAAQLGSAYCSGSIYSGKVPAGTEPNRRSGVFIYALVMELAGTP